MIEHDHGPQWTLLGTISGTVIVEGAFSLRVREEKVVVEKTALDAALKKIQELTIELESWREAHLDG